MGRSVTPKYAVCIDGKPETCFFWDSKAYGRPINANVEKFAMAYAKSLEAGGPNARVSEALGYVPYPRSVVVTFNGAGHAVVASWKASMFQVYG